MTHRLTLRIYYEDTDLAGIVYYANYLKFIERGRSEFLRSQGIDQTRLKDAGLVFAVRRFEADFMAPARFDDLVDVLTRPLRLSGARLTLGQEVVRGDSVLFRARVTIVCLGSEGRPARLPQEIREAFSRFGC